MSLCEYKDIFGKPGEGVHSYRIFNIAIIDVLLTVAVALFISHQTGQKFSGVLLIAFLLGIVLHRLFCVRTTVDSLLF